MAIIFTTASCGPSTSYPTSRVSFVAAATVSSSMASSPPALPSGASSLSHGQFGLTGSPSPNLNGQAATRLIDGRVLLVAGSSGNVAQLYDPVTRMFSKTGPMNVDRASGATATLLADGRVLVTGGVDDSTAMNPLAAAEIFDPKTDTFSATGSMLVARTLHTATLLANGQVLIAGGFSTSERCQAAAELYDPRTGVFAATGSMVHARASQTATLLEDGRVLLAGGSCGGGAGDPTPASAEIFDPGIGRFSPTGTMTASRCAGHTATRLQNGEVLVEGGNSSSVQEVPLSSAETFDPVTGRFIATGSMLADRDDGTATLLADGQVLVAGGSANLNAAELYDPAGRAFAAAGHMAVSRAGQTATLLLDGQVLIVGGAEEVAPAELYQP